MTSPAIFDESIVRTFMLHPDEVREAYRRMEAAPPPERRGGLTLRQRDCLRFIERYVGVRGYSPSFDEIKDELGLQSRSGVHRVVDALEERGFIRRLPARRRAIEIIARAA